MKMRTASIRFRLRRPNPIMPPGTPTLFLHPLFISLQFYFHYAFLSKYNFFQLILRALLLLALHPVPPVVLIFILTVPLEVLQRSLPPKNQSR